MPRHRCAAGPITQRIDAALERGLFRYGSVNAIYLIGEDRAALDAALGGRCHVYRAHEVRGTRSVQSHIYCRGGHRINIVRKLSPRTQIIQPLT